ncbi:cellulose biosynthesis protein BcsG, partial [Acinetobacter baumannii]
GDYAVLEKWYKSRLAQNSGPLALYYNTVTLHDGNRLPDSKLTSIQSYPLRLTRLLDDIDKLIALIAQSGRKAVVVFVPEHGAALRGDANQI